MQPLVVGEAERHTPVAAVRRLHLLDRDEHQLPQLTHEGVVHGRVLVVK